MARQYIGIVKSPSLSDTTNPIGGFSTETSDFGILNNSIKNYNFAKDVTSPYVVGTSSTVTSSSVSSITISPPTCQEGDLLLMFFAGGSASRTFSSIGWTTEKSSSSPSLFLLSKIATSSESNYTVTITGGATSVKGAALSIRNWSNHLFGNFTGATTSPTFSVPNDSSNKKLFLFFFGGSSTGQNCNVSTINEFKLYLSSTTACSMDISAIYRTSPNTSLSYTSTNSAFSSTNKSLAVVIT